LLTKLLSKRLQKKILQVKHKNQYGFIKEKDIQGCLAWAFEYLFLCKKSKREVVILKLDFKKTFDKIEHKAIMEILLHKGFGSKWQLWMDLIMKSGTSSILPNEVPGKVFHCKRGVRQDDPLSPLLFVLAADLLQSVINFTLHNGSLTLPLPLRCGTGFSIVQYADDTLLFLEACPRQLMTLKGLLNTFVASTCLRVDYQKSNIYPINVDQHKMEMLAQTFGCCIGSFPFTYLGLPLGPNKPNVDDMFPLVQRIERRLISTSDFLTQAGRLEMVNSILSALHTFYMSTIKLPPTIIKMIDKYRKHCFWRGFDLNVKKHPLVAWQLATMPKKEGGLGIIKLQT
jgi:hypothetical protein